MGMSKAALPARYGSATKADEAHPRFSEYRAYRSGMSRLMVDSEDFRDWLRSVESEEVIEATRSHPRFAEWHAWFVAGKRGAEKMLPNGQPNTFPGNFRHWLATA